jgi:hypothetical protein
MRYIENEEIKFVTGILKNITYTMNAPLAWDPTQPADTIATDMTMENLVIDESAVVGHDSIVMVPLREVVEFEDEKNVKRMKYFPFVKTDMELRYTDYRVVNASIEIGDTFDNVRILDYANIGTDITGKFTVLGFAYGTAVDGTIDLTGLALINDDTQETIVVDFKQILDLNEVYTYEIPDAEAIDTVISQLAPGDSITIVNELDVTNTPVTIDKENITLKLDNDVLTSGADANGIRVVGTGSATITGEGKIVNNTPYTAALGSGAVRVKNDAELTFDGSGVTAVIADDPVNKGQFGVCVYQNAKLTINKGDFAAGWYCVSGNGNDNAATGEITINDGNFVSVSDYVIYHPQAGKMVINGGTFNGAAGVIAMNNGEVEINGGTFNCVGGGDTGVWPDGTSGMAETCLNLAAKYGDVTCTINGGKFKSVGTVIKIDTSKHAVNLVINGGKFSEKPLDEWLGEGCICTSSKDVEGYYTVLKP